MVPRRPILFGGIVVPVLWTGLIWASLRIVNPILNARIDWPWFVASQLAFGIAAGLVVSRREKIATQQHEHQPERPVELAARHGLIGELVVRSVEARVPGRLEPPIHPCAELFGCNSRMAASDRENRRSSFVNGSELRDLARPARSAPASAIVVDGAWTS